MTGQAGDETTLLQLLGQIDNPNSSLALARLAATTRSASVRHVAIDVLKTRPRRDYVGQLVSMIHGKIQYSIVPVSGPGSTGTLVIDTQRVRMVVNYDAPALVELGPFFRGYVGYDANGLPMIAQGAELEIMSRQINPFQVAAKIRQIEVRTAETIAEANLKADVVRQRMAADVNPVETANDQAAATNQQIIPVLELPAYIPSSRVRAACSCTTTPCPITGSSRSMRCRCGKIHRRISRTRRLSTWRVGDRTPHSRA
jgi:hypothetical protein